MHLGIHFDVAGPVAQRIRHLTTNQGIPGSNPGRVVFFLFVSTHQKEHPWLLLLSRKFHQFSLFQQFLHYIIMTSLKFTIFSHTSSR